jgi:hypothetical protein
MVRQSKAMLQRPGRFHARFSGLRPVEVKRFACLATNAGKRRPSRISPSSSRTQSDVGEIRALPPIRKNDLP